MARPLILESLFRKEEKRPPKKRVLNFLPVLLDALPFPN
jgi:hypothetical protein